MNSNAEKVLFRLPAPLLAAIADKKTLDDEIKAQLNDALTEYGKQFAAGAAAA